MNEACSASTHDFSLVATVCNYILTRELSNSFGILVNVVEAKQAEVEDWVARCVKLQ